jgi:carbon-monoxide dehydrogenase medium subunit
VRNRGTFGGSLAHADPAADWPAVALALDARVCVRSARGTRELPIDEFFVYLFTTALEPDEVITHVDLPRLEPGAQSAYVKVPHPATGFAVAAAAVVLARGADGRFRRARVAITGAAATPYRARRAEAHLVGHEPTPAVVEAAAQAATDDVDVLGDGYAPVAYRRQLASVVTRNAIDLALSREEETRWTCNR